jgi:class III poly(R)-hydroxyalkanoic acid synthase PhaE subunit
MNDNGDWLRQMADLQQQYWRSWQGMTGPAFAPPQAPRTPWQDGMDAWKQMFTPPSTLATGSAGTDDVGVRLMAYGRQYVDMLQQMANQAMSSGGAFDPRAWLSQMRSLHERFAQGMTGAGAPAMPWFGGVDPAQVEQLVRMFTSAPAQGMRDEMRGMFDLPAFGIGREHQERAQALAQAWIDYQDANARYNELMMKAATRTLDLLEGKLADREQPGRQIESARALYDLWIDAAEDAFAEVAMSPDYRAIYGDLVNSQMRVRAGINAEMERLAAQFGMPTRTEIDSMARQLHELRRALRQRGNDSGAAAAGSKTGSGERVQGDAGKGREHAKADAGVAKRPSKSASEGAGSARGVARGAGSSKAGTAQGTRRAAASGAKAVSATPGATKARAPAPSATPADAPAGRGRTAAAAAQSQATKARPKHGNDAPMIQSTARKNAGAR